MAKVRQVQKRTIIASHLSLPTILRQKLDYNSERLMKTAIKYFLDRMNEGKCEEVELMN